MEAMITLIDERNGMVKTTWKDVRKRVQRVEPEFTKIVDELSVDDTFPLYMVYFPYGAYKGDTESSFLPKPDGSYYRLSDPTAPKDVMKHLGYGASHAPLAMVLEKNFELFIELPDDKITIPSEIYTPGSFLSFIRNLGNMRSQRIYSSNKIFSITSGARSAFMLPNIGCATHHGSLQRNLNIRLPAPKSLYDHWAIFREITKNELTQCDWRSCLIYFSEKWVDKINNDPAWSKLNKYLHLLAWQRFEYDRNRFHDEFIFSMLQKKRNLKPNPYLMDTARHLFITAMGAAPGYAPATNEDFIPLEVLQKAYIESYGLKKYMPIIMQPSIFDYDKDKFPIYYSLQYPSTFVFSPKSRKISSRLHEMRELEHIVSVCINEFSKENSLYYGTTMNHISKLLKIEYFHNEPDQHNIIKPSIELSQLDPRFNRLNKDSKIKSGMFSGDSPFVRGCVAISVDS